MDAGSLAFSVAQTLLAALQSKELKQICSFWNYESELERLQKTVKTVKSVLLDADDKQVLSEQEKDFIDELKDALYDADDLFDEFTALVEQHPHLLQGNRKVPNKSSNKAGPLSVTSGRWKCGKSLGRWKDKKLGIVLDCAAVN